MTDLRKILPMLSALPVFEEAARCKSFTGAARNLGMAQPSVSRFIANLENQLGVALFTRQHSRIALTPDGEVFFEATRLGLGHIRSAIDNLDRTARANILTIRCTAGFAHMWFLPRRDSLQKHLPRYEFHMSTADHVGFEAPRENDITISFGDGDWPGHETHLLFEEVVFTVCAPAFARQHHLTNSNLTLEQLSRLPLLVQDRGEMGWMDWQSWFQHFGGTFTFSDGQYMLTNYALALQAAMEGKGIALAWEGLADQYLSNDWLIELTGMKIRTGRGYYLVFSSENPVADGLRHWAGDFIQGPDAQLS